MFLVCTPPPKPNFWHIHKIKICKSIASQESPSYPQNLAIVIYITVNNRPEGVFRVQVLLKSSSLRVHQR